MIIYKNDIFKKYLLTYKNLIPTQDLNINIYKYEFLLYKFTYCMINSCYILCHGIKLETKISNTRMAHWLKIIDLESFIFRNKCPSFSEKNCFVDKKLKNYILINDNCNNFFYLVVNLLCIIIYLLFKRF